MCRAESQEQNLISQVGTICDGRTKINFRLDIVASNFAAVTGNERDGGHEDDETQICSNHVSTGNGERNKLQKKISRNFFLGGGPPPKKKRT